VSEVSCAHDGQRSSPASLKPSLTCRTTIDLEQHTEAVFEVEPGAILVVDRLVEFVCRWPSLTEETVKGIHFVQEDSPDEIGEAIVEWMATTG
jgi:hypothetical protein